MDACSAFEWPAIQINEQLSKEYASGVQIFPPRNLIFNAFESTPLNEVKVVILGQDPYHDDRQVVLGSISIRTYTPYRLTDCASLSRRMWRFRLRCVTSTKSSKRTFPASRHPRTVISSAGHVVVYSC